MKKRLYYILLPLIVVLVLALVAASFFLLDNILTPERNSGLKYKECYKVLFEWYPETHQWVDSLQSIHALNDTTILSSDGDKHHALYLCAASENNKVALLVHGYNDNAIYTLMFAKMYADNGFNVLMPDLHGCGLSEGDVLEMGWKDRNDVLEWMDVANNIFADSTKTTRMVVHGVSMGAATTMCVAGEQTPQYAKCFVEDCGYTSVFDEFKYFFKKEMGIPAFPLLYTTSLLCKVKNGWSFAEASPINQVAKCKKPMMFIHGNKDNYVPYSMLRPLYDAKKGDKDIYIGKDATHSESYRTNRREYIKRVMNFVNRYI